MLIAPHFQELDWLIHGFGFRDSVYPAGVTTVKQIHSGIVIDAEGRGGDRICEGDALISDRPGVTVGIRTADCVPVLLADSRTRAVAAIHAGWRGTAAQIVTGALADMAAKFGTRAEDVYAAIGPAIGVCCYETGPDVAVRFAEWVPELTDVTQPTKIDLPAINAAQLRAAGVLPERIWIAGECTFCLGERYFSFRREKDEAGRLLSYIGTRA